MANRIVTIGDITSNRIGLRFPIVELGSLNAALLPVVSNSLETMGLNDILSLLVPGEESLLSILGSIPEKITTGQVFPVSSGLYTTGETWEATADYTLQRISWLPRVSGSDWVWDCFHLSNKAFLYLYIYYDKVLDIPVTPSDQDVYGHFSDVPPYWIPALPSGGVFCAPTPPYTRWADEGFCFFSLRSGYGRNAGVYEWSMLTGYGNLVCTPEDRAHYPKHFLSNGYPPTGYNISYEQQNAYWIVGSVQQEVTCYPLSDLRKYVSNLKISFSDSGSIETTSYWLTHKTPTTGARSVFSYPTILNTPPFSGKSTGKKISSIPGIIGAMGASELGIMRRLRRA